MRCRTFEYSSKRLDTGVTAIDNIETNESLDALQYQFVLETGTDSGTNYLLTGWRFYSTRRLQRRYYRHISR